MKIVTILSIMAVLLINVGISYGQSGNRAGKTGAAISGRIMSDENGESLPYAIYFHCIRLRTVPLFQAPAVKKQR